MTMPFAFYEKLSRNLGKHNCFLLSNLTFSTLCFLFASISPIKLVVAKCWDPNPKGYFTIPRTEPVRPIDPGAWVAHTEAARGDCCILNHKLSSNNKSNVILGGTQYPNRPPSVATMSSTTTTMMSSMPETERKLSRSKCTERTLTKYYLSQVQLKKPNRFQCAQTCSQLCERWRAQIPDLKLEIAFG